MEWEDKKTGDGMMLERAYVNYLKGHETERILRGIASRIQALDTIGGSFVLKLPTQGEKDYLSAIFKKDFSSHQSITINLKKYLKAHEGTRFEGIDLIKVLELYFDRSLVSNKDMKRIERDEKETYFKSLSHLGIHAFIKTYADKEASAYKWFNIQYKTRPEDLKRCLVNLDDLIGLMEDETWHILPILAARVTKNPHALDKGEILYQALVYYLCYKYKVDYPSSSEELKTLFGLEGILDLNINAFVQTYGLKGQEGWEAFYLRQEPLTLVEMNIKGVDIRAINQVVYCFENPAVFLAFILRYPDKSAICTGGQINRVALEVLKCLNDNQVSLCYHGDFDPEGLLIADKLLDRFKCLNIFAYDLETYKKSQSEDQVITSIRLKQLDHLRDQRLITIGQMMKVTSHPGYEEFIIEEIFKEVDA